MTQHLATFKKNSVHQRQKMFKNAQKSFSFSARGAAPDPAGEAMTLPPDLLVRWGGKYLLPISFPVNAFGVLISGRFFSARCYASAVLAVGLCPCPCPSVSVCPSQVGVLLKQLNVGSHKQHHTIARGV